MNYNKLLPPIRIRDLNERTFFNERDTENPEIRLVEESCEHYAVIDNEIVWYGSINLLSKEDAEDNLMRVCSKDIAAELLEMTFGSKVDIQEW